MKWSRVIVILIVCSIFSTTDGFFIKSPDTEDPRHHRFDIFIQELVKFKIRFFKNVIYPILVEIPWKRIFEPEKYFQEQAILKKHNLSDTPVEVDKSVEKITPQKSLTIDEPENRFGMDLPSDDMIRMSSTEATIEDPDSIDEIEMLRIIPDIVEQMREQRVTHEEKVLLRSIYGELWPLVEAEARRDPRQQMHPILRAIFNSRELQMTSVASTRKARAASNDVYWNTIGVVDESLRGNLRSKRHNPGTPPSVRIMDAVAVLVREAMEGNLKSPKKEQERKRLRKARKLQKYKDHLSSQDFLMVKNSPETHIIFPASHKLYMSK